MRCTPTQATCLGVVLGISGNVDGVVQREKAFTHSFKADRHQYNINIRPNRMNTDSAPSIGPIPKGCTRIIFYLFFVSVSEQDIF